MVRQTLYPSLIPNLLLFNGAAEVIEAEALEAEMKAEALEAEATAWTRQRLLQQFRAHIHSKLPSCAKARTKASAKNDAIVLQREW